MLRSSSWLRHHLKVYDTLENRRNKNYSVLVLFVTRYQHLLGNQSQELDGLKRSDLAIFCAAKLYRRILKVLRSLTFTKGIIKQHQDYFKKCYKMQIRDLNISSSESKNRNTKEIYFCTISNPWNVTHIQQAKKTLNTTPT